jgi:hypothetical protein
MHLATKITQRVNIELHDPWSTLTAVPKMLDEKELHLEDQ